VKRITLQRHAKSSWDNPALPDIERPLAKRGKCNSKHVAKLASHCLPAPDLILSSTARRTIDTAGRLGKRWPQVTVRAEQIMYLASAAQMLKQLAQLPDDVEHVLLVGHHPGLSNLAGKLASYSRAWLPKKTHPDTHKTEPTLVTGALLSFTSPIAHWREVADVDASLDTLITPAQGVVISADKLPKLSALHAAMLIDLQHVLRILDMGDEPLPEAVHFLRTRIKRLRAALRLLRNWQGDTQWRARDSALQKIAQCYAAIRELDVCVERLMPDVEQQNLWQQQRTHFWQKNLPPAVRHSAQQLLKSLQDEWQSCPAAAVPDAVIHAALKNSYRRARKQWRNITADNYELLHHCRILTKRLFIQADIVGRLQHKKRLQNQLDNLIDLLGEQHDAVVMLADPDISDEQKKPLKKVAEKHAKQAIKKALVMFFRRQPGWLQKN
jgi:phosphohistidine phosphatase